MSPLDQPDRHCVAEQIRELLDRAAAHDGIAPLSERFRMLVDDPGEARTVARREADGAVAAYGARLPEGTIELVVAPNRRRLGLGTTVLRDLLRDGDAHADTVWAHGNLPAAQAFAARHHLVPIRRLHKMTRELTATDAATSVHFPDGFELRAFAPGDEDAWLAVNAAAFATHPEQGRVGRQELAALMAQPWFDPADLLMLWGPDGQLAGSHWTKIDPRERVDGMPAGEVYVLALAPAWQGFGIAAPLTVAGLRHVAAQGLRAVVLYVDEDNPRAVATYRRLGFGTLTVDAQYARDGGPGLVPSRRN
ncbi:MAG: mycothiol synthase [Tetrasphaera sp.]